MLCCGGDGEGTDFEQTVGECPNCGNPINSIGKTTEEWCGYSPIICKTCEYSPCDGSC